MSVCFDSFEDIVVVAAATAGGGIVTAAGKVVELSSSPRAALTALFMVSRRPCLGRIAAGVGKTFCTLVLTMTKGCAATM